MYYTTTTRPLFKSPCITTTTTTRHHPLIHRTTLPTTTKTMHTQIKTSSFSTSTSIIEHIVLFNLKPTTEITQLTAMVNGLNTLKQLPMVLHLTTTQVLRNRSSSLTFTHILHSRYATKRDLAKYSSHPDHLSVVRTHVLPICSDLMTVDWVAEGINPPVELNPGAAVRVQLFKLKEDSEAGKTEVFGVIKRVKEKIKGVEQFSYGENFSPGARSKGFEVCYVRVFGGVEDVDAHDKDVEIAKVVDIERQKLKEFIDSLVVVDYV